MGTRADYYVGRDRDAEWLGSTAFDGHTPSVFDDSPELFPATEQTWRDWVSARLANRDDATVPADGWPWPWDDSATTDYAYAWDRGVIWGSYFGSPWFRVDPELESFGQPEDEADGPKPEFPDMSARKAVTYGPRSGLIVMSFRQEEPT